ncbi:hypothetical protein [Cohnella sp. JJ-181]|uniref:hypothetical protein n=1 Tax=Cohnella rhizoplanae TaxID=2974897 RepID=UPI0022FFA0E9|nr:hypothetical protein [Cohnella sp. JJ-181]CAI6057753.1 hypothetical protein COHCIP112018_01749 [Cohnella sp. JJ-181]
MKMATFVMGGIVGAALTVAIRRNPKWSMAAGMLGRELKNRSFGSKDSGIGKLFDMRFSSDTSERGQASGGGSETRKSASSSTGGAQGLGEVANLVSEDQGVRDDVNKILEENGQNRI